VEAETNAYNIVMPLLSRLSYLHDVALDITGYLQRFAKVLT